jgi:hypothetical protein
MDPLDRLFEHLDRWRHLPAYQLERRADVFFSVYLKEVVEKVTGVALEDVMIPELPIKHDGTSQSDKVDYALFAKDRSRVYFVELKTDAGSRNAHQDAYLKRASDHGFRHVVDGIRTILLSTTEHQKYHHLAVALKRLGYLEIPGTLAEHTHPELLSGRGKLVERIVVAPVESSIEVLYVQPEVTEGDRCIDFAAFADHVGGHADPFSQRFAAALRGWRTAAGLDAPV